MHFHYLLWESLATFLPQISWVLNEHTGRTAGVSDIHRANCSNLIEGHIFKNLSYLFI